MRASIRNLSLPAVKRRFVFEPRGMADAGALSVFGRVSLLWLTVVLAGLGLVAVSEAQAVEQPAVTCLVTGGAQPSSMSAADDFAMANSRIFTEQAPVVAPPTTNLNASPWFLPVTCLLMGEAVEAPSAPKEADASFFLYPGTDFGACAGFALGVVWMFSHKDKPLMHVKYEAVPIVTTAAGAVGGFLAGKTAAGIGAVSERTRLFVEPEVGARFVSAKWNGTVTRYHRGDSRYSTDGSILGPGATIGTTFGSRISNTFAILAHLNIGWHSAPNASLPNAEVFDEPIIKGAQSMDGLLGIRAYPLGGDATRRVQPYLGLAGGIGGIAWTFTDVLPKSPLPGVGSWDGVRATQGEIEVGALVRMKGSGYVRFGARYTINAWASTSFNGLDTSKIKGNSIEVLLSSGYQYGYQALLGRSRRR